MTSGSPDPKNWRNVARRATLPVVAANFVVLEQQKTAAALFPLADSCGRWFSEPAAQVSEGSPSREIANLPCIGTFSTTV